MPIPKSFFDAGFMTLEQARERRNLHGLKRPGIMISTYGKTNTGKTEFILSCPGPGVILAVDRMFDAVLDNPNPPESRRNDFVFKEMTLPKESMAEDFGKYWADYRDSLYKAIKIPEALTVAIDGDSDTWELQRLAQFGKLSQVPPHLYVTVNAARRALIARCYDTGKIIVATNKVKEEYIVQKDEEGNPVLKDGKEVRVRSGKEVKQGFDDDNYLWHIILEHLYHPPVTRKIKKDGKDVTVTDPQEWGVKIVKCKSNPEVQGMELWGGDATFTGVVTLAYPHVEPQEWGL